MQILEAKVQGGHVSGETLHARPPAYEMVNVDGVCTSYGGRLGASAAILG